MIKNKVQFLVIVQIAFAHGNSCETNFTKSSAVE